LSIFPVPPAYYFGTSPVNNNDKKKEKVKKIKIQINTNK